MNLSLHIARRYLIAKKSHNAINIISLISMAGVAVGTIALIIILSAFNGFEGLLSSMYSDFNPEIKITKAEGRVFNGQELIAQINSIDGIESVSEVLESQALVINKGKQSPIFIKGVDTNFHRVSVIDSSLSSGTFSFDKLGRTAGVMGILLARTVGAGVHFVHPLQVYVPKREGRINMVNPMSSFNKAAVFVNGIFMIGQPEIDENYFILPIAQVRKLLEYEKECSAIEIKLKEGYPVKRAQKNISKILDSSFHIKNRYQQEEALFKMMAVEKWMAYLILAFVLLVAAFNIIGSLSMLMLDKKDDMQILQNLGADTTLIRKIFLFEGWMISFAGSVIGLFLGISIAYLQIQFGFIKMGGGFVVDAYPLAIDLKDIAAIIATVWTIGFTIAFIPVNIIFKHLKK